MADGILVSQLWRDYVRADDTLSRLVTELNVVGGDGLAPLCAAEFGEVKFRNAFLGRHAVISVRAELVEYVLWEASFSSAYQKALFAALGSIEPESVRSAMTGYARNVLGEDPDELDYASPLQLLWCFGRKDLVAALIARSLAETDPSVRATALDFLEDHEVDLEAERSAPISALVRGGHVPVQEVPHDLATLWQQYEQASFEHSKVIQRIRSHGKPSADFAKAVERAYGKFDRFGWLAEARS